MVQQSPHKKLRVADGNPSDEGAATTPARKKARVATEATPLDDGAAEGKTLAHQQHPTLEWMTDVMQTLGPELQKLEGKQAHEFGGINAFCSRKYKNAISHHGEYECNVTLAQHDLLKLEHKDMWPVVGAIKRLMETVFTSETGEPAAVFPHTITVRATCPEVAPQKSQRLHRSAYLFAFLASWAAAKKASKEDIAAAFFATAHRIRTKFILLQSEDEANRKKWFLDEETDSMADNAANLVGYKRIFAVVGVQNDLQARGLPHDATAVAAWFAKVRWNSQGDALSIKEVNKHIRIHKRLSANPLIKVRLDAAESQFGRRHALAFVSTLDVICSKTFVHNNEKLSTALLLWVVEGTITLMLRGCIKTDISRDTLSSKIVPKLLLIRRIALFLLGHFKYKSVPGVTYLQGYEPENVGKTLFSSWAAFHQAYPFGASLEQNTQDKMRQHSEAAAFLTKLTESQVGVLEFIRSLMSCTGDIDSIVSQAVGTDVKLSPESFFERRIELVRDNIFNLTEEAEKHKRDTKIPEPVVDDKVAAETQEVQGGTAVVEQPVPPEPLPDLSDPPKDSSDPQEIKNSHVYFPLLCFSEATCARIDSVEPNKFSAMVVAAERRIAPWVDIKILPSDPAAIPEVVKAAPAFQQMETTDKTMHVWCAGTGTESVHPDRIKSPHKHTVALDKIGLENAVTQVASTREGEDTSIFAKYPSVFIISDGRRPSSCKTITTIANKVAKAAGAAINTPFPFRLMHSNIEFAHGAGGVSVPEPMETLTIIMGAAYKVRTVERQYLDTPGSNRCRGLNNVPVKTFDIGVSWEQRCKILEGSSNTLPMDDEIPDWTGGDDKTDLVEEIGQLEGNMGDSKSKDDIELKTDTCDVFPWEHNELVVRELLNMFDAKTVVHYNTNCTWPLACARHFRHFVGFARNELHAQHIHQMLVAMVVAEIIEGTDDGFRVRKFLSKQRSLGGSTEDKDKNKMEGSKVDSDPPDNKSGTGTGTGTGSGHESESSSEGEDKTP